MRAKWTVQAVRKLATHCLHSPGAAWFDICKIAVKTAPTIAERTPYPVVAASTANGSQVTVQAMR